MKDYEIRVGVGGWRLLRMEGLPEAVYVRLREVDGVLRVTELYLDGRGAPIEPDMLERVPVRRIEAQAELSSVETTARQLNQERGLPPEERGTTYLSVHEEPYWPEQPGPDLSTLASYYDERDPQGRGWITESFRAQHDEQRAQPRKEPAAPIGTMAERLELVPQLSPPTRLDEDFLQQVAKAYKTAVELGLAPATAIARRCDPPARPRTVQSWFVAARRGGQLAPANFKGRIH